MSEQFEALSKFSLPNLDAAFWASAMRGLIGMIVLVGLVWLANGAVLRWLELKKH